MSKDKPKSLCNYCVNSRKRKWEEGNDPTMTYSQTECSIFSKSNVTFKVIIECNKFEVSKSDSQKFMEDFLTDETE